MKGKEVDNIIYRWGNEDKQATDVVCCVVHFYNPLTQINLLFQIISSKH
mgnify:CR=1 FL=1